MVEALDWLKRMTAESRSDGERADGWTHKIREGRVDGLTTRIVRERAGGLTHNISEERAGGLTYRKVVTQMLVDGDGSESSGFRWTKTRATSCLRRTQKKFDSSSTLGYVRCEKTWLRMAQVTPSTEFYECALRKMGGIADLGGDGDVDVMASMASMVAWVASTGGVDGFDGVDGGGVDGVEWWLQWRRWRPWWPGGVDGVEWWRRMVVDWGLRHRGH